MKPDANRDDHGDRLVDIQLIARYVGFVGRAVRRHKLLALVTFVLVVAATMGAVRIWPRTYHVQAKLLTQRSDLIAALSNPGRVIPTDADSPTRAVSDLILRRSNLIDIVKKTDLLHKWKETRAPILRAKDALFRSVFGEPTEDDKLDALVGLLEQQIKVSVSAEGIIAIDLDWRDARLAYELVDAALQDFLDIRRGRETSAISESISILERSAANLQIEIDHTVTELQTMQPKPSPGLRAKASRPAAPAVIAAAPVPAAAEPMKAGPPPEVVFELVRLKTAIDAKHQEIAKLEDTRRHQVSDLQARLAAGLTMYTEGHPAVASLRQSIATLADEPPPLAALRDQARSLEAQYDAAVAAAPRETKKADGAAPPTQNEAGVQLAAARAPDSPAPSAFTVSSFSDVGGELANSLNPISLRLRMELGQLANVRDRMNGARIELAASQASFRSRYIVTRPPEVPRKPTKPNATAILLAGTVGALVPAIAAAAGMELASGVKPL